MKSYQEKPTLTDMDDTDLLREEFLRHGRKQGLPDEFLLKVLDFLLRNQFYPANEHCHFVRNSRGSSKSRGRMVE